MTIYLRLLFTFNMSKIAELPSPIKGKIWKDLCDL